MADKGLGGVPTLKYLDLRGFGPLLSRGGAVRLLFQRNGIDFKEELVSFPDWNGGLKQKVIDSGENPSGMLPVVHLNGNTYTEHHAILRTLSRRLGEYGVDIETDFLIDRASDSTSFFRDQYIASLLQPDTKEAYLKKRPDFYKALDTLLAMTSAEGACVVGSQPSFADDLWFALLSDDVLIYGTDELDKNVKLKAFYEAYSTYDAVKAWKEGGWKADTASA